VFGRKSRAEKLKEQAQSNSLVPVAALGAAYAGAKPVSEVPDALAALFARYAGERRQGERFHEWARRVPNAELGATLTGVGTNGRGERR
jgi:ferredoxin-nitrite reductase